MLCVLLLFTTDDWTADFAYFSTEMDKKKLKREIREANERGRGEKKLKPIAIKRNSRSKTS